MKGRVKRGLSTIVVTLIIILVSLVAVGIIWIVVRNVIQRGSEGIQMGQFTLDAKIKNVNLENASNANNVNLTVKRNPGEGAFTGLKFIFYDGRNSEVITEIVSLNELEERRFNFHLNILNVSQLVSISIVPILNVNGKESIGNVLDKYTVRGSEQYQLICSPATCSGLGYTCGTWNNGTCSGNLNCGNCSGGYICGSGGTCVSSCTPSASCSALGYQCGLWSNGTCSGNLNCGNCSSGYTCNATGSCVAQNLPSCGNNIVDPGEACDGINVSGYTCATVAAGFVSGTLSCSSDCKRYITTSCVAGNTINALSCSQTDVQNAINSASSGDTVLVPAGNCTWAGSVSIPNTKNIILQGAGIGNTIINKNSFGVGIYLGRSSSRVTEFTLNEVGIVPLGQHWRVDHCELTSAVFSDSIFAYGDVVGYPAIGLVDHCHFINGRVGTYGGASDDLSWANWIWAQPLGLGTNNAVFVEDCVFDTTVTWMINAIDSNVGGRYVFRYNTVNDRHLESHSIQGTHRASRSWEIYENMINQVNQAMWIPMRMRGGTGVIFNNTITGTITWYAIPLDNIRSCNAMGAGGLANGTSPWDGNTLPTATYQGYPARDQIGRSTDQWLWTDANPYPPQALDPAYCWNNKHGTSDVVFELYQDCPRQAIHIQEGRDYFNNIQKPGYVPYPYPHPLTLIP